MEGAMSKAKFGSAGLGTRTILAMLGAAALGGQAAATEFKLGHVYEATHPIHTAAVAAGESFAACTNGAHSIQVYPASQLGKETALNEQIQFAGVDMILTGQIFASSAYPALAIGAAPYIFRDREHALAYRTSDVFADLMAGWSEATGQVMMGSAYFGAFQVGSQGSPVNGPDDMKGLKIRVPDSPFYTAFPNAVGANPTPIAFDEVYLALQQGVVGATVNPVPVIYAKKFYEVLDYVAMTNHLVEYVLWVTGSHVWSALSDEEKACLETAVDAFGAQATEEVAGQEDDLQKQMADNGWLTFTYPDAEPFKAMTASVIADGVADGKWTQETVDRIAAIESN
jgi:tripartite ATP-independent transporter DctP family solute receptor